MSTSPDQTDLERVSEPGEFSTLPGTPESFISWKYLTISVVLSLLSMGAVIYFTYTPGVLEHLKPKRLPGLFIAIAVSLLRVFVAAARMRFLSDRQIGWMASTRLVLSWDFASAVTPSTIGGAPAATYAMTREGINLGKSAIIILYGVLLDQMWYAIAVPILLITGVYLAVIPPEVGFVGQATMILIYLGLIVYGVLLAYGLLVNPSAIKSIVHAVFKLPLLRKFQAKAHKEAENIEEYSNQLNGRPIGFLFKAFLLTVLTWLCRIALPVIVILSLLPANELLLILRSLSMHLAFLVVPTPGGSGGVEGLFYLFMDPLVEREGFIGLAVFLWRIISYYISIGLGIMAMMWYLNRSNSGNHSDSQHMKRESD